MAGSAVILHVSSNSRDLCPYPENVVGKVCFGTRREVPVLYVAQAVESSTNVVRVDRRRMSTTKKSQLSLRLSSVANCYRVDDFENGLDRNTNGRPQIKNQRFGAGRSDADWLQRLPASFAIIIAGFSLILLLVHCGCWTQPVSAAQAAVPSPSANPIPAATVLAQGYALGKEQYARAIAYARAGYRLYFVSAAYQIAILVAILAFRLGPAYRKVAERVSSRRFIQAAIFATLLTATISVLRLPVAMYGHSLS